MSTTETTAPPDTPASAADATTDAPPAGATVAAASADPAAGLRAFLDGEHAAIRDRVRAELVEHADLLGESGQGTHHEHRERVLELLRLMAANGGTGLGFPTEFGGGGDVGGSIAAFETLAFGDLSLLVKAGVQFGLFGGAVLHLGTRRHHEAHLARIIRGELLGCFAMTETGHGSNVQALRTTATYDHATREFVIDTPDDDARKDYIGNAALHGHMAVVFAQLVVGGETHGVHALLVPIRDEDGTVAPGVRVEDCGAKLGLGGVDNGRLWFDGVRVPVGALLDRYASVTDDGAYTSPIDSPDRRFFTMLGTLVQGRVSVGGAAQSAAKLALAIAVRYGERRRQFGPPGTDDEVVLLDYRAHQRRLLPLVARSYALHFAQATLTADLDRLFAFDAAPEDADDTERRQLESLAAGLKTASTWHATTAVQQSREACGGAGYLSINRFADLKADTDVFTTFEGDNTVLLQLVAKGLLTRYRDEFESLDQVGMVRFVVGTAMGALAERAPLRELLDRFRDTEAGLLDREWQLAMLRWREEHTVGGLARRLKRGVESGSDAFTVFNDCQDHVLAAARAHVDRVVLEAFAAAADRPDAPAVLGDVCGLHALHVIEQDRGWFQEHNRLSSTRSKAVTAAVNELCGRLRRHARALVDGFGVPEELLPALVR